MPDLLKSVIQDLINDRTEQAQVAIHDYIVAKTQQLAGLSEAKEKATTVYISVGGRWSDEDDGDVGGSAVYPIDVPSGSAQKIVDHFDSEDNGLDSDDNIDRFEQDGWEPREASTYGHAHSIDVYGASLTAPVRTHGKMMKKNYYTMVYALRDLGLLTQEYAESIAKT